MPWNKAGIKIRQPLSTIKFVVNDNESAEFVLEQKSVILDELNIKNIERIGNSEELIKFNVKPNLKNLGQKYGKDLQNIRKFINDNS